MRREEQDRDLPDLPETRQLSEDDSDEESLHRIIREVTEQNTAPAPEPEKPEERG